MKLKIIESWKLQNELSLALVDELPAEILREQAKFYLAPEYPMLPKHLGVGTESIEKLKSLKKNLQVQYTLKLALLDGDKLVGWTDGWQDSVEQDSFFMGASLILPGYRRKGLYSALVQKVFEITKNEGFQSVWSLHVMTNNPVIIGKLKMDFHIYGFEVNTRYGALVRLVYHHNEMKRKALKFRAGAVGETEIQETLRPKLV